MLRSQRTTKPSTAAPAEVPLKKLWISSTSLGREWGGGGGGVSGVEVCKKKEGGVGRR